MTMYLPTEQLINMNTNMKNSKKDQELIDKIKKEKNYYTESTTSLRSVWEECWKLFNSEYESSDFPWRSKKFIPKILQAVNSLAAFLVGSIPTITTYPRGDEDEAKAEFMRELVQFQWESTLNMKPKIITWAKSAVLFGNGIMKVGWNTKVTDEGRVLEDDPFAEPVHIMDFYCDPYISEVKDQTSVIHRFILDLDKLKQNKSYKNLSRVEAQFTQTFGSDEDSTGMDSTDLDSSSTNAIEKVEIWERWTENKIVTLANPKSPVIIKDVRNPYGFIPFVNLKYQDQPIPNRFYAIGAIEPNINLQRGINSTSNQIIDNATIAGNNMFKRRRGANIDPRQLVSKPAGFVDVDEMDDLTQLEIRDHSQSLFSLLEYYLSEFEESTTLAPIRKGNSGSDTATGASIKQKNIETITNLVKENIESGIAEIGKMIIELDVDNIQNMRSMRVFDPEERKFIVVKFSGENLTPEVDLQVQADSTISLDRNIVRKQLLDLISIYGKLGIPLDLKVIGRDYGRLSGLPNVEKYTLKEILPEPPMEQPQGGANNQAQTGRSGQIQNQPERHEGLSTPAAIRGVGAANSLL